MVELDPKKIFTHTFPLGPIAIDEQESDPQKLELLFDKNNKLYQQLNHDLTIVIGRKGSGKTALLNSVMFSKADSILISLPTADTFSQIVDVISEITPNTAYVEQIGRVWEVLLWGTVFCKINREFNDDTIRKYVHGP